MTNYKVQSFPQKEIRGPLPWAQIWVLSLNSLNSLCSIEFEQSNEFLCSLPCKVSVVTVPFYTRRLV